MGTKTGPIPVYPVTAFDAENYAFWFGTIERILEVYPFLEHPHKQSFYMLLFVEQAEGHIVIDECTYRLDQPKLICIKPNSVFCLSINRTAKGHIICFTEDFFSLRYNNNVLHQFAFLKKEASPFVRLTARQAEQWNTVLQLMKEEMTQGYKEAEKVLRSYLNILLCNMDKRFQHYSAKERVSGKEEKIIQFEKLVEEHYVRQKAPSFYAGMLHISTNYLNKLCHDCRGIPGGELIRKRVTIEARRLLHYTTLSVAEVAFELGFESPSYFITFFKKNTGQTPELFRKSNR